MKKYNRALSLLLIICIMFCAFFGSVESSSALVLNPWTIAVCGALLTAAGLTFGSPSDMEAASQSFGASLSDVMRQDLIAKAEAYQNSSDNDFFLTLGADLIAAISGWLSGVTAAEGGSVVVGDWVEYNVSDLLVGEYTVFGTYPASYILRYLDSPLDKSIRDNYFFPTTFDLGFLLVHYNSWSSSSDDMFYPYMYINGGTPSFPDKVTFTYDKFDLVLRKSSDALHFYVSIPNATSSSSTAFLFSEWLYLSDIGDTFSVLDGVASIPFDSTWSPDSTYEEKKLIPGASVKLPKGLVNSDGALDSDVVGAMTPESVRAGSADVPDVVVGTGAGSITGTGEGTGIFEGVGSLVLDIPIIGTIASTLSGILEAIKGFFDVSRFDLNFESLKVGLTGVFPFCIPFDFFNAVKMFSSDTSSFVFDINLETEYFTIDHTVDLTPFRLPILFFRYVVVFWFGFILISRTKDFMKW